MEPKPSKFRKSGVSLAEGWAIPKKLIHIEYFLWGFKLPTEMSNYNCSFFWKSGQRILQNTRNLEVRLQRKQNAKSWFRGILGPKNSNHRISGDTLEWGLYQKLDSHWRFSVRSKSTHWQNETFNYSWFRRILGTKISNYRKSGLTFVWRLFQKEDVYWIFFARS